MPGTHVRASVSQQPNDLIERLIYLCVRRRGRTTFSVTTTPPKIINDAVSMCEEMVYFFHVFPLDRVILEPNQP